MPDNRFFDTNVLIYAFAANDPRNSQAEALLMEGGVIGVQVLNEFTNVARRKLRWNWEEIEAALAVIEDLLGPVRPLTAAIHARAVEIARDHELAFYDASIVAAAIDANCSVLMSEDMQHGRKFGMLRIENPFQHRIQDDPFSAFEEWDSSGDRRAYAKL
jgi:predicted nucleic acid-binding protein